MIDLTQLPPPSLLEELDFETLYAGKVARFQVLYPDWSAALESDPVVKLLELSAYDEMMYRARVNDAARATMLAYATSADLDHLAGLLGVTRQIITPADPDANPPIEAVYETDDRLRARTQLSLEGYSTAGPVLSYVYHALSSDPAVRDVSVSSPQPGTVRVTVLAEPSDEHVNGVPSAELQAAVLASVSADDVRPLTDIVEVAPAELITYTTRADLVIGAGPDAAIVLAAANAAHDRYVEQQFRLGLDVSVSGLHAALHQAGVSRVDLLSPAGNLAIAAHQAARCIGRDIRVSGVGV